MKFFETKLRDVFVIEIEKIEDERGFFSRTWDLNTFDKRKMDSKIIQCNISFNKKRGTIRGLHFQVNPYGEAKTVRCTKGKALEVIVDLRIDSNTYKQWIGIELSEDNYKMIHVPKEFALGFQTLEDNTELFYQMSQEYMPDYSRGICWNDPIIKISWPLKPTIISKKDLALPKFSEQFED